MRFPLEIDSVGVSLYLEEDDEGVWYLHTIQGLHEETRQLDELESAMVRAAYGNGFRDGKQDIIERIEFHIIERE